MTARLITPAEFLDEFLPDREALEAVLYDPMVEPYALVEDMWAALALYAVAQVPQRSVEEVDAERDAFLEATMPALFGECLRPPNIGSWCGVHATAWPSTARVCNKANDADDFADRVIEAWEGRGES